MIAEVQIKLLQESSRDGWRESGYRRMVGSKIRVRPHLQQILAATSKAS